MATALVPPKGSCIVECKNCCGVYLPSKLPEYGKFEACPFCGCKYNSLEDTIPVWRYNIIKWFRSGKRVDEFDNKLIDADPKPVTETVPTPNTENNNGKGKKKKLHYIELYS